MKDKKQLEAIIGLFNILDKLIDSKDARDELKETFSEVSDSMTSKADAQKILDQASIKLDAANKAIAELDSVTKAQAKKQLELDADTILLNGDQDAFDKDCIAKATALKAKEDQLNIDIAVNADLKTRLSAELDAATASTNEAAKLRAEAQELKADYEDKLARIQSIAAA